MRIGVLSDLHCELEPSGSRWINVFEPERLDERIDTAFAWFAESEVALILLLGDVVQFPNADDLAHVFSRLTTRSVAPLALVPGNHDLRLEEQLAKRAREHGIRLLHEEPLELDGIAVSGVGVERGPAPPQYLGDAGGDAGFVVASHFPVLSEASKVAAAGLPYAGDLVNRADVEAALRADGSPKLVLSAHIHSRCTTHAGPLLQFTVGALIEPPFDATIVEVDGTRVRRTARRLGGIAVTDPVFTADDETWQHADGRWEQA